MINKKTNDGVFTSVRFIYFFLEYSNVFFFQQDEESFKTFAVYCGLALHHAKLYDKIRRSEQKYKVQN